jgi:hypothetical protein
MKELILIRKRQSRTVSGMRKRTLIKPSFWETLRRWKNRNMAQTSVARNDSFRLPCRCVRDPAMGFRRRGTFGERLAGVGRAKGAHRFAPRMLEVGSDGSRANVAIP